MSNFLDLLRSLGTYVDVAKDIYNYTPDDPSTLGETPGDVIDQYLPSLNNKGIPEETEDESWFTTDKQALIYPQDLFNIENNNQAYVFFLLRDPTISSPTIYKRIGLYMPPGIRVNYGTSWEEQELPLEQVLSLGSDIMSGDASGRTAGAFAQKYVANAISKMIGGGNLGDQLSTRTRILPNPHQGLIFKNVNFREFSFSFEFLARSANESESIRQIIKVFKWGMHPGGGESSAWVYPNIFDIYLLTPSHKYMFNISQSVLTSMNVDYGGAGATTFFKNTGAPVSIKMDLSFKELSVLTKEKIVKDY